MTALQFSGRNGIIMKITVINGKCISDYCHQGGIKNENEILILPNTQFVVLSPLMEEEMEDPLTNTKLKVKVVQLMQIEGKFTF